MKKLLCLLAVLGSFNVMASNSENTFERVLLKDVKILSIEVNEKTVRCSAVGYGAEELKINIAGLDGWTILDHSNVRFGDAETPCLTAGYCQGPISQEGLKIEDVIQGNPRIEKVAVSRDLIERRIVVGKQCQKMLIERLATVIGGIRFNHERSISAEVFPLQSCHL